jgi:CheY-like chemotaxis protein
MLPLLAEDAAPAAPAAPRDGGHAEAQESSMSIMVVDDNVDAAETLGLLLEASGHRVSVEHDPLRALERSRSEAPQVCLLDIGLPGMDGYELARRLRAQPATEHALLVAITGYGQDSDRRLSMEAGFDKHLVKPIDLDTLLAALARRPT